MDNDCPWTIVHLLTGLSFHGQLSMKFNFFHLLHQNRQITVSKIGAIKGTPDRRKLIRSEIELNTQPLISYNSIVS
jgi:hypothetical protein